MIQKSSKAYELIEVLERGGTWSTQELADELNLEKHAIRALVGRVRKSFLEEENSTVPYIYTTKGGFTLEGKPEDVVYESKLRYAIGVGVLVNGVFVFKRCKKISPKQFANLNVTYKPKMLMFNNVIK